MQARYYGITSLKGLAAYAADVAATGNRSVKTEPFPTVVVTATDPPCASTIDLTRLSPSPSLLANLVDNAIKYTGSGGRIHLAASRVNATVEIRVEDTGVGISPDELPRIWDRLFRGDRSRSEKGLGLGLSLVKAIVEAHGGSVAVTTTAGKGSVFTLRFPVAATSVA